MKLKASQLNAGREHTTTAKLIFFNEENGVTERQTETVKLVFRGRSVTTNREWLESIGDEGTYQFVDYLAKFLVSIPDLIEENGEPVKITKELLETFSVENLTALHNAIEETLNPQKPSPEAMPVG